MFEVVMEIISDFIFPVGVFVVGVLVSEKVKYLYHKSVCKVKRLLGLKSKCGK